MRTAELNRKHRATQPVPAAERPTPTGDHRARRTIDLPIAGILGILVILLAVYLTLRG